MDRISRENLVDQCGNMGKKEHNVVHLGATNKNTLGRTKKTIVVIVKGRKMPNLLQNGVSHGHFMGKFHEMYIYFRF